MQNPTTVVRYIWNLIIYQIHAEILQMKFITSDLKIYTKQKQWKLLILKLVLALANVVEFRSRQVSNTY